MAWGRGSKGKNAHNTPKLCPNCGFNIYTECNCLYGSLADDYPTGMKADDPYIDKPIFGTGLITDDEVKRAAKPHVPRKKKGWW